MKGLLVCVIFLIGTISHAQTQNSSDPILTSSETVKRDDFYLNNILNLQRDGQIRLYSDEYSGAELYKFLKAAFLVCPNPNVIDTAINYLNKNPNIAVDSVRVELGGRNSVEDVRFLIVDISVRNIDSAKNPKILLKKSDLLHMKEAIKQEHNGLIPTSKNYCTILVSTVLAANRWYSTGIGQ